MTDADVMRELQVAFEYTYLHEDWVTPLGEALEGVSVTEALWKPSPDSSSIWEIVLHLAKWNENIVDRVEWRETADRNEDAHWPKVPAQPSEESWADAQLRLARSFDSVAKMLLTATLEKVQASRYGVADLMCRFTHAGYHIGQITKIREYFAQSVE